MRHDYKAMDQRKELFMIFEAIGWLFDIIFNDIFDAILGVFSKGKRHKRK